MKIDRSLLTFIISVVLLVQASVAQGEPFPDGIDLPLGFFPEGFTIGQGTTFYAGSLGNGAIYKGDLLTGEGEIIVPPAPPFFGITSGLSVDSFGRLWVAGGSLGNGRVYDGETGTLLATYQFTDQQGSDPSLINDVVVTNEAAYFTDAGTVNVAPFQFPGIPRLFVVPLIGQGGTLPSSTDFDEVVLVNPPFLNLDIAFPNINGVEVLGGGAVIVGHTILGSLLHVDINTGDTSVVDLTEDNPPPGPSPLPGNDGLVRRGDTLYVVYGDSMIAEVSMALDGLSGDIVRRFPVNGDTETPTTADLFGNAIYVTDAKFNTPQQDIPATNYSVYRTELN